MMDENAFLQALLANPADDDLRRVYADWLEERNEPDADARARFLRLTVEMAASPGSKRAQKARRKRLQKLAAGLDTNWLAVVSRLPIENCPRTRRRERQASQPIRFDYLCDLRWEDLQSTSDRTVRHCGDCKKNVHYCDTIMDAREHAQKGHCIAVDLGIIRRDGDLEPAHWSRGMLLGWPSPESLREEEERTRPDPVSAARDQRKREQKSRARASRGEQSPLVSRWEQGDRVQVKNGTFAGMEGVVQEVLRTSGIVRVELTIFGRTVPVQLEPAQIESIS